MKKTTERRISKIAKVKHKKRSCSKIITSFSGLGSKNEHIDDGASEVLNFRPTPDGKLVKRYGYSYIASLPGSIRGFWEGTIGGYEYCFCVCGNRLYQLDSNTFDYTSIMTLSSYSEPVEFCEFNGALYLLDGKAIFYFDPDIYSFMTVEPYAPLIGVGWHPTAMGEFNELPNLLTSHMRVHYINTIGTTVFYLPYYAKSIDCILVNGAQVYDFTFKENSNYVTVPSAENQTEIAVAFSALLDATTQRQMTQATRATAIEIDGMSRMLLYGTAEKHRLYISTPVTKDQKNYCDLFYYCTAPLYFTSSDVLFAGSREDPIVTVCPYYDTALIFNKSTTRLLCHDSGGLYTKVVLNGIGCTPRNGVQPYDSDLITVCESGIYRLKSKAGTPEELISERISDVVYERMKGIISESTIVFQNHINSELWICQPQDDNGLIWVCNTALNTWYTFDDIPALGFWISRTHGILILNGNVIQKVTPNVYSDNGNSYRCSYQSKYIDLGDPDFVHRSMRWSLTCNSCYGITKNFMIYLPQKTIQNALTTTYYTSSPEYYEGRIATMRHRYFRFQFSSTGDQNVSLYRVAFYAKA